MRGLHEPCCHVHLQVTTVRLPVHRDVSDGDCRSRPCSLWCSQHYCLCSSWQGPHLQPDFRPPHYCKILYLDVTCASTGTKGCRFLLLVFVCQGDRFGGALDAAAKQFSKAFDSGMLPMEFVNKMKKDGKLIMGIGHRVKSVSH